MAIITRTSRKRRRKRLGEGAELGTISPRAVRAFISAKIS
jgi:hypothetical protein